MITRHQLADPAFCDRMRGLGVDPRNLPGVRYDRVREVVRLRLARDAEPSSGPKNGAWIDAENTLNDQEFEVYQAAYARGLSDDAGDSRG